MYNISKLKADLTAVIHGTTLDQITGVDNIIDRAARELLLTVDPQETKRLVQLTNQIFNQVYDYACPTDLKGNAVIDIRPQVNRYPSDLYLQIYNQAFDLAKQYTLQPNFTINFNTGLKTIRIDAPLLVPGVVINYADTITGNGTWNVGGTASNLQVDNINYAAGGGSLSFNLAGGSDPSTGYLENSTMSAVDLTSQLNQGREFFYVYLPTAADFESIEIRWGSSASNYYKQVVTTTQEGTVFQDGWNLLQANWLGATVVGSPNPASIGYLRISYVYNGNAQTAVHLNDIVSRLGTILQMEYYSKFMFRDEITGAFQETVTDDSNLINLDTETYNLLFYLTAGLTIQQQQGLDAMFFDNSFFGQKYTEALELYKARYKSELQKPQSSYYTPNYNSYNKYYRRYNY